MSSFTMWRSSKSERHESFQKKIDGLILVAKVTRDAGEFAPFPFIKAAASTVVTLLESIRGMRANKESCALLAQDVINLLEQIAIVAREAPLASTRLQKPVENFVVILNNILDSVLAVTERSSLERYFQQASDADAIRDHRQELNSAFTLFMTVTQIQLRQEQERSREEQERAREEQKRALEQQEKERKRAAETRLLASLPVVMARWNESKTCLKGTRIALLDEIRPWARAEDSSVKPIYWLADVAGSGKSTVANHMANEWRRSGQLGGCFAFSRDVAERTNTKHFCTTLCSDLAKWHPELRSSICESIEADPSIASRPFPEQFNALIVRPVTQAQKSVVFVVDALDECVKNDRSALLNTLLAELPSVSHLIKFFITSRPEWDISKILDSSAHSRAGFDLYSSQNTSDVRLYLESQLMTLSSKTWSGPTARETAALAERAGGLFIWASTACRMLNDSIHPRKLLTRLLEDSSLANLDQLYLEALKLATLPSDPDEREDVAKILQAIVTAMEPLSIDAIDELLGVEITEAVVTRLASVLSVSSNRSEPVRILHPTFREFLTDAKRCTDSLFLVDVKNAHRSLSYACFRSLQTLRKDICNIGNPSLLNSEVPNLEDKLAQFVSEGLRYACRFWTFHAAEFFNEENVQDLTLRFFRVHFLNWLEVLSLMKKAGEAAWALRHLATETRLDPGEKYSGELRLWYRDALRFTQVHHNVIQTSALHIYISGLAFTPQSTKISQSYVLFPGSPPIIRGRDIAWISSLTMVGHTDWVRSVVFSPDGTRIASGSDDNTIRIWDAVSGSPLGSPLKGHSNWLDCIAFSQDGARITSASVDGNIRTWDVASGLPISSPIEYIGDGSYITLSADGTRIAFRSNNNIRIWNADSGLPIGTPLEGHFDSITCIAFSPDSSRIVSSSADDTIRIWDMHSYALVGTLSNENTRNIYSIDISPNNTRIASGSSDHIVRICDAVSGSLIGSPLTGHTGQVRCITFSSDGTRIATGSDDNTIRIWDAATTSPIGYPLYGHTSSILCIKFSPDGTNIASSSSDHTIRIWEALSGSLASLPPDAHNGLVTFVTFSADGTRIASSSSDHTIRLWSADSGSPIGTPLHGHTKSISCIVFSPDGSRIASGSNDETIRLWDTHACSSVGTILKHGTPIEWIAFSSDSARITSGSGHNTVLVWDVASGLVVDTPLNEYIDLVNCIKLSPDGTRIACGFKDNTVRIWDTFSGSPLCPSLDGHADSVQCIAFSPDGTRIASASKDTTVRIWDASSGLHIATLSDGHTDSVQCIAFSPDSTRIASGSDDNTVRIWNAISGIPMCTPRDGHSGPVHCISFSPDGTRIASGSEDNTVRIWDAVTGTTLGVPLSCTYVGGVRSLAFTRDNGSIKASYPGVKHHWELDDVQVSIPPVITALPGQGLGAATKLKKQIELDGRGWVYQVGDPYWRRLFNLPHANRGCVAICGSRLATGSSEGQITLIDCSPLFL